MTPVYKLLRDKLFYSIYDYIDVESEYALPLFERQGVHLRKRWVVEVKESQKYRAVVCLVYRWEKDKFEKALEGLENKMLLLGYTDYSAYCEWLRKKVNGDDGGREVWD